MDSMLTDDLGDRVEVVLVRHGRTASNAARRFMGRTDEPLDEVGRSQVRALAGTTWDGVHLSLCSPLRRATETAALLGLTPQIEPDLQELDQGELEGLAPAEAVARFPEFFAAWQRDPGSVIVPGGEGMIACRDRALAVIERHARTAPSGSRLVVVTHLMVIASIRCAVSNQPLTQWTKHRVPNAGIARLRWDGVVWTEAG
jgi:broad specificity phosphatase PhoE